MIIDQNANKMQLIKFTLCYDAQAVRGPQEKLDKLSVLADLFWFLLSD